MSLVYHKELDQAWRDNVERHLETWNSKYRKYKFDCLLYNLLNLQIRCIVGKQPSDSSHNPLIMLLFILRINL